MKKGSRTLPAKGVDFEEKALLSMVKGFDRKVTAIVVTDKASSKKALDFVDGCYEFDKRVHAFCDGDVKKAHELHKSLSGKRKKLLDASKAARRAVGNLVVAYEQAEQRKARIVEAEEQERLRKKAEAEREERAEVHEEMGMPNIAEEIREEEVVVPAPSVESTVAKVEGLGTVGRWKAEISGATDVEQQKSLVLLVKYIAENPDHIDLVKFHPAAGNRLADMVKSNKQIPGLRIWEEKKLERSRT